MCFKFLPCKRVESSEVLQKSKNSTLMDLPSCVLSFATRIGSRLGFRVTLASCYIMVVNWLSRSSMFKAILTETQTTQIQESHT